jgi:hypothetical protein
MKHNDHGFTSMKVMLLCLLFAHQGFAQGFGSPLTTQGLDRTTTQSAASRAAGGISLGLQNELGLMFMNPATMQSLKGIQVSVGGAQQYSNAQQAQHYAPLKYYSNFSLLMEGLTGLVPDPDTSLAGVNAGDTVQRPFDAIGPNWSRSKDKGLPIQALLAVPFSTGEYAFAIGIGAVEYSNLDYYYQNNNVLSPSILSERPVPITRPTDDSTLEVKWSQMMQSRDGRIRGYGGAISASLSGEISVGVSALFLDGKSDDFEQRIERGKMTFFANYFRLDSVYGREARTATSDYSGKEFTVSGIYRGRYVTAGFSIKPPTTIERTFTARRVVDTTGSPVTVESSSKDKMKLPWRGTIGISIVPAQDLILGLEYELRSYASAVYRQADGTESKPWLSASVFHIGAQYTALPWLAVRAGMRGQAEVFEPEGNPIVGEPVSYSIYSTGVGLSYSGIHLNLTYEYALMKYQDVWGSAISLNKETRNTFIADVSYEIPLIWQ